MEGFEEDSDGNCSRSGVSGDFSLGPPQSCTDPVEGFARLSEQAADRGLDLIIEAETEAGPCNFVPGALAAQDMDGDGDVDLLFNDPEGFPLIYAYQDGRFSRGPAGPEVSAPFGRPVLSFGTADLDGDSLPEVVVVGESLALLSWNLGELGFSDWEVVLDDATYPRTCISSMGFGDVDGDGDLDLALPGLDVVAYEGAVAPAGDDELSPGHDRLFLNEGGVFRLEGLYPPGDADPHFSITSVFTDRDHDGDMDWLACTDRPHATLPPQHFYRNDGGLELVDDAPAIGADLRVSTMGLGINDLNGDGLFDYCMSDVSWDLTCMLSDGLGAYYQAGPLLGLRVDLEAHPELPEDWEERLAREDFAHTVWVSWGLAMLDLDNDGRLDLAATAGPPPDNGSVYLSDIHGFQPDAVWQGQADGTFLERTQEVGFGLTRWSYGLVSADFDGDGSRELVLGPSEGRPIFWDNPCGLGHWLEVELVGLGDNAEGFGARVQVGGDIQEMHNVQAVGQSVSRLHFGLGEEERVSVRVEWPDGAVSEATDVPVDRLVTVSHPSR